MGLNPRGDGVRLVDGGGGGGDGAVGHVRMKTDNVGGKEKGPVGCPIDRSERPLLGMGGL